MKVKIRNEVYNRIILAKTLLCAGTDACESKRDRMTFTKGILLLHDAAEAALGAVADHLHAPLREKCFLLEYYSLIQDNDSKRRSVPYKTQMRNLNTIRKHAKHQGILPDPITNSHFPTTVSALINDLCETYLELDFSTVSLKSLIKSERVRKLVDSAEEDIKKGRIENALVDLTFALHYVCDDFPSRLFVLKDDKSLLLPPETHTIEHTVKLLQHGVDPYLYSRFKALTPMLAMEKKTGNIIHWWDQHYGHPANWTPENAKFCLDFCIDTVLKFQRDEDTRFKLIAYTDVFEDMVEPTGEQAILWNRSLQPPRYGFPPTWSSSTEREATFVLKKVQKVAGLDIRQLLYIINICHAHLSEEVVTSGHAKDATMVAIYLVNVHTPRSLSEIGKLFKLEKFAVAQRLCWFKQGQLKQRRSQRAVRALEKQLLGK